MQKIVILGASFAGLDCALNLEKKFKNDKNVSITLIDRHGFYLFRPGLLEIAALNEDVGLKKIESRFTLPIRKIIGKKRIEFLQGEIREADISRKTLQLANKQVNYDYLILAQSKYSDFSKVSGMQGVALPLDTLADALRVRNNFEFLIQAHRYDAIKSYIKITVLGGGFRGVELAGSLAESLDSIAKKNNYPREKLEVMLYEAESRVLPDLNYDFSQKARNHLQRLGVKVETGMRFTAVNQNILEFMGGERLHFDMLIWAAGSAPEKIKGIGHAHVDGYLRSANGENIFILSESQNTRSKQEEIRQAEYLSYALPKFLENKRPLEFVHKKPTVAVNIGRNWALANLGKTIFSGKIGYFLSQYQSYKYYKRLLL